MQYPCPQGIRGLLLAGQVYLSLVVWGAVEYARDHCRDRWRL